MVRSHSSACAGSAVSGVSSTPASLGQRLEPGRRSAKGSLEQRLVALGQQVEGDVAGGDLLRQQLDPRLGRMDAALQRVELEVALGVANHQLAVQHVAPGGEAQLGEVAGQRFAAARLDVGLVAVDEDDRPEAVQLRLIRPLLAERQLFAGQRQLRLDRRGEGEASPLARRPALAARPALPRVGDRHRREQGLGVGVDRVLADLVGGPLSTILPTYITAIRSETWRTTPMSWATKR